MNLALLQPWRTAQISRGVDGRHAEAIVEQAAAILDGRFEVLGHGLLRFDEPVNWHVDPVHDRCAPLRHFSLIDPLDVETVGDHKVIWELNRHGFLVTLAQAYLFTGDRRYPETAAHLIRGWLTQNPPGLGINWTSSLEVALRAISWLYTWPIFRPTSQFDGSLCAEWLRSLACHARHIARYPSYYYAPNTHLLGEGLALNLIGLLVPELNPAPRYRRLGLRIFQRENRHQLREDGFHFEQSACYHRYAVEFLLAHLLASTLNGLDPVHKARIHLTRAVDAMLVLTGPDGRLVNVGDEDGGQLFRFGNRDPLDCRPLLAAAAIVLRRPELKAIVGSLPAETIWLLGPESAHDYANLEHADAPEASRALQVTGYCGMRDGWASDANYLLFDAGPHGSERCRFGHGHSDSLSVAIAVEGRPFLTDPGTGSYSNRAIRDRLRSTFSHSTAWVDGQPHCLPGRTFGWASVAHGRLATWVSSPQFDLAEGWHDGYERGTTPVRHTRRVIFWKDRGWAVWDTFDGVGQHTLTLQLVIAPGVGGIEPELFGLKTDRGTIGVLWPLGASVCNMDVLPLRVSPRYGHYETGTAYRLTAKVDLPADFVTIVRPGANAPAPRLADEAASVARHRHRALVDRAVVDAACGDRLVLRSFSCRATTGGRAEDPLIGGCSDAAVVWLAPDLQDGLMVAGTHLVLDGETVIRTERPSHWVIVDGTPSQVHPNHSFGIP